MPPSSPEDPRDLIQATLAGDRAAFTRLALLVWPIVQGTARRRAEREDDANELLGRLLERLEERDFARLRTFEDWRARHPEKGFDDWLRIVLANLARDLHRERVGRAPRGGAGEAALPSPKRLLNELAQMEPATDLAYRPRITSAQTAREVVEFAAEHLPPLQRDALSGWAMGEGFEEIQRRTGVDSEQAAVRLVRAALATLRRKFS